MKPHTSDSQREAAQNHERHSEHSEVAKGADGSGSQHAGMAARGVTRSMAEQEIRAPWASGDEHDASKHKHPRSGHQEHASSHGGHGHEMSPEQRLEMLQMHHKQTLWIYWTLIVLGFWTMLAPVTFGHMNPDLWVDPSGGRGVWFSEETHTRLRAILMTVSDVATGLLLVVFGWRSLVPNRPKSLWACCFLGIWLTFAPILFWAPTAASYVNATVVGALLIALTVLIPGMPNMIMYMQHGPPTPPGWTYNPSSWPQRWIMIVLAFAGWLVSRYLAAFQLGYITYSWDPFFGFRGGTEPVLNSRMSHMWPISDAGLGALSYTFEFLMGYMGSPARWRTMPWMVAFFGILVIPLGLTHIFLVISQPVVVHHWCTMCLLAAAIMLPMIPLEADEVVAMGQHMVQAKRRGDRGGSLWQIFWKGGTAEGCTPDERSPELMHLPHQPAHVFKASIWGMSFPWPLIAATVVGAWLMFSPTAFGLDIRASAADVGHLAGALIVTVSVISMGEILRIVRYLNVVLGLIVAVVPWLLHSGTPGCAIASSIAGAAVIALSIPRGRKTETYGLWDRYVR